MFTATVRTDPDSWTNPAYIGTWWLLDIVDPAHTDLDDGHAITALRLAGGQRGGGAS